MTTLLNALPLGEQKLKTPNELVNWRRSPAGAQGTNSGQYNAEGMAAVGVHVELTVRLESEVDSG